MEFTERYYLHSSTSRSKRATEIPKKIGKPKFRMIDAILNNLEDLGFQEELGTGSEAFSFDEIAKALDINPKQRSKAVMELICLLKPRINKL